MPFFQKKSISAQLVGHNLVAAFKRANPPLVWKFDLERNHSFTIALQGEEGDWELGVTSPKGEFYPVVHFVSREDAEEALAAVEKILLKKRKSKLWTFLKILIVLLVLAFLVFVGLGYFMSLSGASLSTSIMPSMTSAPSYSAPAPQITAPSGVPVPADDVLRAPN